MTVLSPCVGLCRIETPSDLCSGCARIQGEITSWETLAEPERDRIWASLPERRAALGIDLHRLPWSAQKIRGFVVASLKARAGIWVFGAPEAVVEPEEAIALSADDDGVAAVTRRGAVRFSDFGRMRALAAGRRSGLRRADIIALVVPRELEVVEASTVLTDLGPDDDALDPAGLADHLYDLGLGAFASRFCVRTGDPDLRRELDAARGTPWASFLPRLASSLVVASPTRVVVTPVGRAEVFTPIPPLGGASPMRPHMHLLPAVFAAGHEAPPGLGIPAAYAFGALHCPDLTNLEDDHDA